MRNSPHSETIFNTSHINIAMDMAIENSGAIVHFLLPGIQVANLEPSCNPLTINLPDGTQLKSTHTCEINLPWLQKAASIAHIVPGMSHISLVLIKVLTDAGCKVVYDKDECRVYYNENIVWDGGKEPTTGLWVLPINPIKQKIQPRRHIDNITMLHDSTKNHMAANAYTLTSKESLIKYLHQCLFSPTKRTLVKSIDNKPLTTWPGLTAASVPKHLPESSPATHKGHMKRQSKGLRSTATIADSKSHKEKTRRRWNR